jgi:hypothetical protein
MREEFLLKVLEYGRMPDLEAFKAIAEALGLEFYHESPSMLYTLSSESFLLDISGDACTMIFVEEDLNSRLGYIQEYLNHFLPQKHIFYCILRFLTRRSENPQPRPDCSVYKVLCNCILRGDYCANFDPGQDARSNINVFTHSSFDPSRVEESGMLAYVPGGKSSNNLASTFTSDQLSFRHLSQEDLYYQEDNIRVSKRSVFIDGERSSTASFAFSRGLSLRDSVDVARIFE